MARKGGTGRARRLGLAGRYRKRSTGYASGGTATRRRKVRARSRRRTQRHVDLPTFLARRFRASVRKLGG